MILCYIMQIQHFYLTLIWGMFSLVWVYLLIRAGAGFRRGKPIKLIVINYHESPELCNKTSLGNEAELQSGLWLI